MEDSGKTGPQGNTRSVRVAWFPTYGEVRHLLGIWPGRARTQITRLHSAIMQHTGTPDDPADWSDPDSWIPELLSGEDHELAYAIWEGSDKTVNPRHTAGSWDLVRHCELLEADPDGDMRLTDRGSDFIDHVFGSAEALVDKQEGLIGVLRIVGDRGPARSGVLVDPWGKFLVERNSPFRSTSTIKDTLGRRLSNLLDRDLLKKEGLDYSISKAGVDYLKRVGPDARISKLPRGVTKYADDEDGRTILEAVADSIEYANSLNPECWATIVPKTRDLRLYVGSTMLLLLHASSELVEVTLLPELLEKQDRERIRSAQVTREYKWPEGARRCRLTAKDFIEQWPSIKVAHREAITHAVMKTPRRPAHRTDLIAFLNRTLGTKLRQPGYVDKGEDTSIASGGSVVATSGFGRLTQSLRERGLLFAPELVANYVLALQTKRFAILTGISGTGKTKIAMALAEHFPSARQGTSADSVEVEVTHSHIEWSRIVLPAAIRSQLIDPSASVDQTADREVRVRYPAGCATLSYYWGDKAGKKSERVLFKGAFKKWFQSTFEVGDRFWIRVHPSNTEDLGELEIGLPDADIIERTSNYEVVPVRPDWVDNRGLLGYLNPLTGAYATTPFLNLLLRAREEEDRAMAAGEKLHPFFVILDEMNLARVEHYFSDFLSALESGKDIPLHEDKAIERGKPNSGPKVPRRLTIPGNVLFTGTVNVDETTYMFSPKVLDRAFTIEFDQVDLEGFTQDEPRDEASGLNLGGAEGSLNLLRSGSSSDNDWKPSREDWKEFSKETPEHHKALVQLHGILERQHRHFGYRVANEIARFVNLAREQAAEAETGAAVDAAFDLALLQKVLPKFHGTQQELQSLLEKIFQFAVRGSDHVPRKDETVGLDDWEVVKGRLVARSKSQPPSHDPGAEGNEKDPDGPEAADADTDSPAYPRTGAKVLRMLQRLGDRGFTSFIE